MARVEAPAKSVFGGLRAGCGTSLSTPAVRDGRINLAPEGFSEGQANTSVRALGGY
jgi:hypothetical protein